MIVTLIGIIIGIVYNQMQSERHYMNILLGGIIGLFASVMFSIFVPLKYTAKREATRQYIIYSMNDNNTISGNFVLGTGSINGESVYSAYVENDNSIIRLDVPTNRSVIKFIDSGFIQTITQAQNFVDWSKIAPYIVYPLVNPQIEYEIQVDKSRANFTNQIEFDLK